MDAFFASPLWYTSRSTGLAALVALTVATVLGVAATSRALSDPRWPRFATQALHRNTSLLAMALLGVHVIATAADSFVDLSWWAVLVPGVSSYARTGVAVGALALDLLLVVAVTGALRTRMPHRAWRRVHQAAYAAWPLAVLHFLVTGTDTSSAGVVLAVVCSLLVLAAGVVRLRTRDVPGRTRSLPGSPS